MALLWLFGSMRCRDDHQKICEIKHLGIPDGCQICSIQHALCPGVHSAYMEIPMSWFLNIYWDTRMYGIRCRDIRVIVQIYVIRSPWEGSLLSTATSKGYLWSPLSTCGRQCVLLFWQRHQVLPMPKYSFLASSRIWCLIQERNVLDADLCRFVWSFEGEALEPGVHSANMRFSHVLEFKDCLWYPDHLWQCFRCSAAGQALVLVEAVL